MKKWFLTKMTEIPPIAPLKQCRSTMVIPGTRRDGVRVWPSRWKILRGTTNVPSHVPWQAAPPTSNNIWNHLLAFVWTWVFETDERAERPQTVRTPEQPWYKLQASGPPKWCNPKSDYLYPTWQTLLSLSHPACGVIITGGFSSMGNILSLVRAAGHSHYGISVFGPLHR